MKKTYKILGLSFLIIFVLLGHAKSQEKGNERKIETRVYDVSNLLRKTKNYPYNSDVLPPTRLHSTTIEKDSDSIEEHDDSIFAIEKLRDLITESIDPESWITGTIIEATGNVLVISQSTENHERIADLLIKLGEVKSRVISINAKWLLLNKDKFDKILANSKNNNVPQRIDSKALEALKEEIVYQANIHCLDGQTVNISSGQGQTVVTGLEPVVANNAVAMAPETKMVQWGAILEITTSLSTDGKEAKVDVNNIISNPNQPIAKIKPPVEAAGKAVGEETLSHLDFNIYQFQTSLKIPLNKTVVIGAMSLIEGGTPLYLVLEVTKSE